MLSPFPPPIGRIGTPPMGNSWCGPWVRKYTWDGYLLKRVQSSFKSIQIRVPNGNSKKWNFFFQRPPPRPPPSKKTSILWLYLLSTLFIPNMYFVQSSTQTLIRKANLRVDSSTMLHNKVPALLGTAIYLVIIASNPSTYLQAASPKNRVYHFSGALVNQLDLLLLWQKANNRQQSLWNWQQCIKNKIRTL